ncbi:MAG: tetratricopeptide repeat protein [Cyanobacteriota/Melainabacteria group bacterium]
MAKAGNSRFRKKQIALALSLAALGMAPQVVAPVHATSSRVIELNNAGVRALNQQNFQEAIRQFEEALKVDSTYELARKNLAIAYNNYGLQLQKSPMQALKQFHRALLLDPSNATTKQNVSGIIRFMNRDPNKFEDRVDLGDSSRKSGDFTGAIVEYKAALEIKNDGAIWERLGDVYRVENKLEDAENAYRSALGAEATAMRAVKLGQTLQADKKIAEAIGAYGQALKLNPNDSEVLDALVAGWEAALAENPIAPENHIGLGQALQLRGDFNQAAEEYKQAIRFSQGKANPTAQKLLADLPKAMAEAQYQKHVDQGVEYQKAGNAQAALAEYGEALKMRANSVEVIVNIGTVYQQLTKDYAKAIAAYQKALSLDANDKRAKLGLETASAAKKDQDVENLAKAANDSFKAGNFDDAIAKYLQLINVDPKDAATHFNLGAAYEAKKDIEKAIAEYRLAVSLDPNNKNYSVALDDAMGTKAEPIIKQAVAAHEAKQYAQAIDLYKQALDIRPKNDELWYNLASAQYSLEDYRAAEASYDKAYKIDPKGRVDVLYFIGKIEEHFGSGVNALAKYKLYMQKAPSGQYIGPTKERVDALSKDITATIKIKSQSEIATEKDAEDAFNAAVALQKQGQYDQAIAKYNEAISKKPLADYIYGLGTCFQAKKDYDNARLNYNKALSMDADNKTYKEALASANDEQAGPLVQEAYNKQKAGDVASAIELYQQATKLLPKNASIWTNLGTAQQQTDDFQQARASYQKGYDLDKKGSVGNLYLMAAIDENYNKGMQALGLYQQYLKADPSGAYASLAQTRVAALSKNPSDIEKLQTSADRQGAEAAADAYNKGVEFQKEKKYDEAIAQFQIAAQAQPNEPTYPYAIGYLYQAKEDIDNAVVYFKKAISLSTDKQQIAEYQKVLDAAVASKAAPFINDGNTKYAAKDYQGAIEAYEQALKVDPGNSDVDTFLGASYQFIGNFQKARSSYMQGYSKGTKDCLYFVGALDENDGNAAAAVSTYQKYLAEAPQGSYRAQAQARVDALRANPKDVQKIVTQAQMQQSAEAQTAYDDAVKLQQESKYDEAIASYKKAIAVNANEPAYYYAMGTAYQAKNDIDSAITNYEKAMSLDPATAAYKEALVGAKQAKAAPLLESAYKKQTTDMGGGKYDLPGAIADYQAALRISDDANTRMNLGTAFQANNNNNEAIAEYTKAINMDAKLADAYYYRGTLYEFLNNKVAARKDYQKYLQLAPTGPNAADCKTRIQGLGPATGGAKKRR